MKPLEQFLAEYFQARTAFYQAEVELLAPVRQRFLAPDCGYDLRAGTVEASKAEQILSVSESDGETLVVTSGKHSTEKWPLRYHLRPTGDSWQIHEVEFECIGCHATGKLSNEVCFLCDGKGWQSSAA